MAPSFFTSALDGGEWSAPRFSLFTLGEIVSDTHWTGDRMDPRDGLDTIEKKNLSLAGNEIPAVQPITRHYTDCAITVLLVMKEHS
jgi:hypothetical protein